MINGLPMIEHLVNRLIPLNLPIIIAIPNEEFMDYSFLSKKENVQIHRSIHAEDPLARMSEAAFAYDLDYVIRVTHDKIFVDTDLLQEVIDSYLNDNFLDYIYLNNSIPGTAFEVISRDALMNASEKFKNVEYIGYAIKQITRNYVQIEAHQSFSSGVRLLVDYPSDVILMHVILSQLGNDCSLYKVLRYLDSKYEVKRINRLPKVTVYTCAHNAEKWIKRAIDSVMSQTTIDFEYILIDDFSTDKTPEIMAKASSLWRNVTFIRNDKNIGLASSCNVALKEARGDYIIRLDADDYFVDEASLTKLYRYAINARADITYPDYFTLGEDYPIEYHKGDEQHHAGGALFLRSALNYVKFTEGIRGHDSLDVFFRGREVLDISYFKEPIFYYTQHPDSLSKTNLSYREMIKGKILEAANA